MKTRSTLVALFTNFLCCLSAQDVLTNNSILKLVKAGMSEEIVLNMVRTQAVRFELGVDGLLALKSGGISDKIINAMVLRGQGASAASAASSSGSLRIQVKTPVRLVVEETLSSGTTKVGETFRLVVAEDVVVGSSIVIAKGAPATGRVTAVKKKSFATSNGKLELAVDSVRAVDGQTVALDGRVVEDGGGAGFGRFGKDVKIEKGYPINAVVDGEKEVKF